MTKLGLFLALIVGLVLAGCQAQAGVVPEVQEAIPLTGYLSRQEIERYEEWDEVWAEAAAEGYAVDDEAAATIRQRADGVEVLVFLGTWCGDTKRELPRFFRVVDAAGLDESQITIMGLDRTKRDAEGLTERWGIEYVPTFIVVRDGQELGRIIERPGSTLEGDIAAMLSGL